RTQRLGQHPTYAARTSGEAGVGGDSIEPAAERAASFKLEAPEATPGTQQRFLDKILGVVEAAEHAITVELQLPPVGLGEAFKRLPITPLGRLQKHRLIRQVGGRAHRRGPSFAITIVKHPGIFSIGYRGCQKATTLTGGPKILETGICRERRGRDDLEEPV